MLDHGVGSRVQKGLDVPVVHERIDGSDKGCHQNKRKKGTDQETLLKLK